MSSDTSMDLLDDAEIIGRLEQVLASLGSGVGAESALEDEEIGGRLEDVLTTLGIAGGGVSQSEDDLPVASQLTVGEENVASEAKILGAKDGTSSDGSRSPLLASDRLLCDSKSIQSDNENVACQKGLSAVVGSQDCMQPVTGSEDHALRCTLSEISLANSAWSEISGPDKDDSLVGLSNISSPGESASNDDGGATYVEMASWDKEDETPAGSSLLVPICSDTDETNLNDRSGSPDSILPYELSSCPMEEEDVVHKSDLGLNVNARLEGTVESKSSDVGDGVESAVEQSASSKQDADVGEQIIPDAGKGSGCINMSDGSLPEDLATPGTDIDAGEKNLETVGKASKSTLTCFENDLQLGLVEKPEELPVAPEIPNKSGDEISRDIQSTEVQDTELPLHCDIPDMLFRPESPAPFHEDHEMVGEDDVELPSEVCAADSELPEFPVVEIVPYEDEGSRLNSELISSFPVPANATSSVIIPNASAASAAGFSPSRISVVDCGQIFPSPRSVTRLKHRAPDFIDVDNLPDCDGADSEAVTSASAAPVEPVRVKTENVDATVPAPFSEDPSERPMCFCPHGFTSRTVGHFHCCYCGLSCRSRSSLRSHETRQHQEPAASKAPASTPPASTLSASTPPAEKVPGLGQKKKPSKPGAESDDAHPKCRCSLGFRSQFSQQGHFHCRCCGFSSRYRTAVTQHENLQHKGHTDLIGKRRRNPSSVSPPEVEGATPPPGAAARNREKSPSEKRIRTGSMVRLSHLSTFSDEKSTAIAEKSAVDGEAGKSLNECSQMELSENPDCVASAKTEKEDVGEIIGTVSEKPVESTSNLAPTSDTDKNITADDPSAKNSDNTVGQSTIVKVATDGSERTMKVNGYSGPLEIPTEVVRGKKVKCPLCVLRFVRIDTLRNHLICVHDVLPAGHTRYSCLPCKFDTSYRYIFAGHCSSAMHATVLASCRFVGSDGPAAVSRADAGSKLHSAEAGGNAKADCTNLANERIDIASQIPARQQPDAVAQVQPEPEPFRPDVTSIGSENLSMSESISSDPKQAKSSNAERESSEAKSDRIRWFYSGEKSSSVLQQKLFDIETFLPQVTWQHAEHICVEECAAKTTRRKRSTTKTYNEASKTRHGLRTRKTPTDDDRKQRLNDAVDDTKKSKREDVVLIPSGSDSANASPQRSAAQKRTLRSTARKSTGSLMVDFGFSFGKRKSDRVVGNSPAERVTLRESRRSDNVGRMQQEVRKISSPAVVIDNQSPCRQLRSKSELSSKDETRKKSSTLNNATTADSKNDSSLSMKSVLMTTGKRTPIVELSRTRSAASVPTTGSQAAPSRKRASSPLPVETHNISDEEEDDLEILENPVPGKSGSENAIASSDAIVAAVSQFQQTLLTWANAASCLTGALVHGESAEKRSDTPTGYGAERTAHGASPSMGVGSGQRSVGGRYRVEVISAPSNVVVIDDEKEKNIRADAGSSTGTGSISTHSRPDLNTSQWGVNVPASSSTAGIKSWTYPRQSRLAQFSTTSSETLSVGNTSLQPSLLSGCFTSASTVSSGTISTAAWAAIGQSNPAAAQRGRPTPYLPGTSSISSWSMLGQTRPTLSVIGGRSVVSLERFSTDNLWAELCRRGTVRSCTCGMYFMDTTLFMLHRSCHCDTAPLRCAFCDHASANNYDFHAHLLDHKK